jgi:hypothetical protein
MTKERRSFTTGAALAIAILLFAVACNKESTQNQPTTTNQVEKQDNALVRMVNAIPGGPAVDVFADDQETFSNVAYKEVTPYKEFAYRDRPTFWIRPAGQDTSQPLADDSKMIQSGKYYTAVALPDSNGQPTLKVVSDDLTPPRSDKVKVRLIHASPDAGEIDVYSRGKNDALFGGVNFQSEAGYREVDPIKTTLEIRPEGKKEVLVKVSNATLEADRIYTIVLAGTANGKLEAITTVDRVRHGRANLNGLISIASNEDLDRIT